MSEEFRVEPAGPPLSWRHWTWSGYNLLVSGGIVVIGAVLLVLGTTGQRLGGVVLVVVGGWFVKGVLPSTMKVLRYRRAPAAVRVVLADEGIAVHDGGTDGVPGGRGTVGWKDCVAVVASPAASAPRRTTWFYVQFVPRSHECVELDAVTDRSLEVRARVAGLEVGPAAGLVWVLHHHHLPLARDLLAQVRVRRPELRIVDSIGRTV